MDARPMPASEWRVITATPHRYVVQLCKHFQHRLPVSLVENHGRIEFTGGACVLDARDELLLLHVTAEHEAALARLEDVVGRHLTRFAFREAPEVQWTRVS